mmetsp:Transcript_88440/g.211134  ORF Transcript_88440/g.211134 Transcript_88440/m.211134 type:complete len:264 (+) Transcript_88440:3887-4678(+)
MGTFTSNSFPTPEICGAGPKMATSSSFTGSWLSPLSFITMVRTYPQPKRRFRKSPVPHASTLPARMMATRSPRTPASSMKCVVSSITRPWRRSFRKSQSPRRLKGSMPLVGSSRTTSLGSPEKAKPTESFRFMPPESAVTWKLARDSRPMSATSLNTSASALAGRPASRLNSEMCSTTVNAGKSTSCCGQKPIDLRMLAMSCGMDCPKMEILPLLAVRSPQSADMVVDLPAPLWPNSAKISPGNMIKFTPSTARISSLKAPLK